MGSIPAAITDLEQLKDRAAVSRLLAWKADSIAGARFDRNELTLDIRREHLRQALETLKPDFNFLSDITCVDWYPSEPRFHVKYHLLSHKRKERVRLNVAISGEDAAIESITGSWPMANFFERELFDLFGIRFPGHPNLRRIMMPEDWEGHPLRRDYPVEGYR